jgi:hypothetical protein
MATTALQQRDGVFYAIRAEILQADGWLVGWSEAESEEDRIVATTKM